MNRFDHYQYQDYVNLIDDSDVVSVIYLGKEYEVMDLL